jgi:hypothetical protein
MKGILTPEEKQYLRRISNYLGSMGMQDGNIEIDMDNQEEFDYENVDWDYITHFTNNYNADIPSGLIPILQKIMKYCDDNNLIREPDNDDTNYQRLEYDIDVDSKKISFTRWWSFYTRGEGSSVTWEDEQGKSLFEHWEESGVLEDLTIPDDGILIVTYNGSGDSGYLESSFNETGDGVPAAIEDWCYRELSDNYSGWEINEGSDGQFIFNFHDMTIELVHTENIEDNASDTYYEESFND